MGFKYRIANENDIDDLVEFRMKLNYYDCMIDNTTIEDEVTLRKNIYKTLQEELNKTIYFFVAENEEGKMVAESGLLIQKVIPFSTILNGKQAYITSVYTDEEYRKKGIQKKLIAMNIQFAKDNGCVRIELNADNPSAISLYESFGFKRKDNRFRLVD